MVSNRSAGGELMVVVGFELDGWDVPERAVKPGLVEPDDPSEGGQFDVVDAAPWSPVADQLVLVQRVDRFGQGVEGPPIDRKSISGGLEGAVVDD